jgi:hypothetical protein
VSYFGALGATPTALDAALVYLRAQKAGTVVAISDANGSMGISGGGGYLVLGGAYWTAMPPAVRAAYPAGDVITGPLVPYGARRIGTAGEILAAIERAQKPLVLTSPTMSTPRSGMSKGVKLALAVGVLGAVFYVATRKGGSR